MPVIQADRDLELRLIECYFVADGQDPDHERATELLATYREAAVKAALEKAAEVAAGRVGVGGYRDAYDAARAIRSIEPGSIEP